MQGDTNIDLEKFLKASDDDNNAFWGETRGKKRYFSYTSSSKQLCKTTLRILTMNNRRKCHY